MSNEHRSPKPDDVKEAIPRAPEATPEPTPAANLEALLDVSNLEGTPLALSMPSIQNVDTDFNLWGFTEGQVEP
jgi:hypothetical protein